MLKTGTCPKCGSTEVYHNTHMARWARAGSYWANTIPITNWNNAVLTNYICTACGFTETYLLEPERLQRIRLKWQRVRPGYTMVGNEPLGRAPQRACPNCGRALPSEWMACPYCGQSLQ